MRPRTVRRTLREPTGADVPYTEDVTGPGRGTPAARPPFAARSRAGRPDDGENRRGGLPCPTATTPNGRPHPTRGRPPTYRHRPCAGTAWVPWPSPLPPRSPHWW